MKRLFVAHMVRIDFSDVKEFIEGLGISGKWVEDENLHFTYRFIGNFESERVDYLREELLKKLKDVEAPPVIYRGLGVFPNRKFPKVLWVGVESEGILRVKERVDASLEVFGMGREEKPFRPHITLMRIKRFRRFSRFSSYLYSMRDRVFLREVAHTVSLVESRLTERGPIYTEIERVELKR